MAKVQRCSLEEMANELDEVLSQKDRVALVLDKERLSLLITALACFETRVKTTAAKQAKEMLADLSQLYTSVYGKQRGK